MRTARVMPRVNVCRVNAEQGFYRFERSFEVSNPVDLPQQTSADRHDHTGMSGFGNAGVVRLRRRCNKGAICKMYTLDTARVSLGMRVSGRARFAAVMFVAFAGAMFANARVEAAPMWGKVLHDQQPNGTPVDVRIWGDEFYQVVESLDGYTLTRDPVSGEICYAELSVDGTNLVSSGVAVGTADPATLGLVPHIRINQAAAEAERAANKARFADGMARAAQGLNFGPGDPMHSPTTGSVLGLTLLVDFSDAVGSVASANISNYLNQVGYSGNGNNGSVRDYFFDVSDGNLDYTNFVTATYYRALNPKSYYDDGNPVGNKALSLVKEALDALELAGHDFSQYDADGDNVIDAINVFYAGTRSSFATGLWPHSWVLQAPYTFSADGVSAVKYQMTDIGSGLTIGTFCHENGHMLMDWPDLYDANGGSNGIGDYCLMGTLAAVATDTNPPEPSAYLKELAGWANINLLTTPGSGLSLVAGTNTFYKYVNPLDSDEFFIVENRRKTARDAAVPDEGLAVWHIDLGVADNCANCLSNRTLAQHYQASLEQADGLFELEGASANYGDTDDLYNSAGVTSFNGGTTPSSDWWDGTDSNFAISNVGAAGASITFDFDNGVGVAVDLDVPTISSKQAGVNFNVTVNALDAFGDLGTVSADTLVTLSLKTGTGMLGGNLSGTMMMGTGTVVISGVNYDTSENGVVLTATASGGDTLTAADSNAFNVGIGPPSKLEIETISSQQAGQGFDVTVNVLDSLDNPAGVTNLTLITLSVNTGSGSVSGTITGVLNTGESTVTISGVQYDTAEAGVVLRAAASGPGGSGLTAANSNSFTVNAGAAQLISIATISSQVANRPFSVGITTLDSEGNPANVATDTTIGLTVNTGTGTLSGTISGVIPAGSSSFTISGVKYSKVENNVRLRASGSGLTLATSNQFNVSVDTASVLVFNTISSKRAGVNFNVTVRTKDAYGNFSAVSGDTAVTISRAAGTGTVGGTLTATIPNSASTLTIVGVNYDTVESGVRLGAAASGFTSGTSNAFSVTAGPADRLSIATVADQGVDVPFNVVVTSTDQYGHPSAVTSSTTITLSKKSGSSATGTAGGVLTGTLTSGTSSVTISGVTWDTAEMNVELTATASGGATLTAADTNTFDVEVRTAAKLGIETIANHAGGTPFDVVVNVLDAADLSAAVATDTRIDLTVMTGSGTLYGTTSGTISAGERTITFSGLDYNVAQSGIILKATASNGDTLTLATSNAFTITAGPAQLTSPAADGATLDSTNYTFRWNTGANVTQYRLWVGTSQLDTADDADIFRSLALTTTSQAVSGIPSDGSTVYVKLFSYISGAFQTISYTFTAPQAGVPSVIGVGAVGTQTAGTPFSLLVGSADVIGGLAAVTQDTGVQISLKTGTGTLSGTLTGTILNGTSTFTISGISYDKAETGVVLRVTRTAGEMLMANDSAPFNVVAGAPTKLSIDTVADAGTNVAFDVGVNILDANDNPALATQSTTITLTKTSGNMAAGTLAGTRTVVIAPGSTSGTISGALWTLDATNAQITATPTSGMTGLTAANSNTFDAATRTPAKLLFSTVANQGRNLPFSVTVMAVDSSDGVANVTMDTQVTISVDTGTGTLAGTLTGTISSGESAVTISGLSYNTYENGVILAATATTGMTGLTAAESNAFNITTKKAELTAPASNGDTLTGDTYTFVWNTGAGVTQYRLWVGSGPMTVSDDADIYRSLALTGTSQLVSGLPTDGSSVYVRLFSYINGVFQQADYTFTAATAGVATHVEVVSIGTQVAGTSFSVGVKSVDALGDDANVTQDTRIALSVQTGTGALSGTTYGTIPNGSGSFTISGVTYDTAESGVVLRGTATAGDTLVAANSPAFTVNGGVANKLSISTISDQGTGVGFSVVVNVLDANDNPSVVTSGTTVTLTKTTGNMAAGTIGGITTGVINNGAGSVTITGVTWDMAATGAEITATPTSGMTGLTPADSGTFNVTTRTPTKLSVATIANQGTNLPFDVIVSSLDSSDQPANVTSTTTVTLSVQTGDGTLGGTISATIGNGSNQTTISGVTYDMTETGVVLTATATAGMTGLTAANSNAFNVGKAKASMTSPANDGDALTGASYTFVWNTGSGVDHYRLWVGDGPMTVAADADIYRSAALTTTSQTVTGLPTDGSPVYVRLYSYINGAFQQNDYTYDSATAGTATKVIVDTIGNQVAGTSFSVRVQTVDALEDPTSVSQDTQVTLSVATGTGSVAGTIVGTIPNGSSSFTITGVTYDTAESGVRLRASATAGDTLSAATSNTFQVSGGVGTKLSIDTIADQGTGVGFDVVVNILDANDNASVATSTTTITLTKKSGNSASGTIGGVTTGVLDVGESSVTISGVEWDMAATSAEITATATSGLTGLTAADSNTFDVVTRTPAKLSVSTIANQGKDQPFDVTVTILDASDDPANATQLTTITLSVGTGTGSVGGTITGTIAANANSCTISGVTYDTLENGVVLTATATAGDALTAANSNAFNVTKAPAVMTNPANDGDTLSSDTVTFTWSTGFGATQYRLWVGSGPMTVSTDADIYRSLALTGTSQTVSGLPMDGSNVYVRLFSYIDGAFQARDYTYVAASVGDATNLAIAAIGAQQAGEAFDVVVNVTDAFGDPANVSVDTGVALSVATGTGALTGTVSVTIASGSNTATISNIMYDTMENGVQLRVTRTAGDTLASATSAAFNVAAGSPSQMAIQTIAAQGAGDAFSVTVEVQDQFGNVTNATQDTLITLTKSPMSAATGTLAATVSGTVSNGSNSVTINGAIWDTVEGGAQLRATASGGDTLTAADSNTFTVSVGGAAALSIATIADQTTASSFAVRVNVIDSLMNATTATQDTTITLSKMTGLVSTGTAGGTLTGTLVGGASGVTINGVTWNAADTGVVLTASASNGDTLTAADSNSFTVTVGAAVTYTISTVSAVTAGDPFSINATARDQYGNAANVAMDTRVSISLKNGTGTVGGTTYGTITSGSSSVLISGITYSKKENNVRLTATITAGDSLGGPVDTNFFNVGAGSAATLSIVSISQQRAGVNFDVVVQPKDQFGNVTKVVLDTGFSLSKKSGTSLTGTLGGTISGTIANGTNSFTLVGVNWNAKENNVILTATRTGGDSLTAADSNFFNVIEGPASQMNMSIAAQKAGEPFSVTVNATDEFGNASAVTQNTSISLSKTTGLGLTGTLSGSAAGVISSGQSSVAIPNLTWTAMETGVQLTASRVSGDMLASGTSNTFTVNAGNPSKLAISTIGGQTSGTAFSVGVEGQDQYGNPSALLVDTKVTLSVASGTGSVAGTFTGTLGVGLSSFTISGVTYDVAETGVSLRASASLGFPLTAGVSNTFTVVAGSVASMSVDTVESQVAGTPFDVRVNSTDANGNSQTVTQDTRATLSVSTGTGTVGGTVFVTIANGSTGATISGVTYDTAESGIVLDVTASGGDALGVVQTNAFSVTAGAAAGLSFDTIVDQGLDVGFDVVVNAVDQFGNPATVSTDTGIAITKASGISATGTVSGNLTGTISSGNGSVTVSGLIWDTEETGVQLSVSRTSGDMLTSTVSNSFTVEFRPAAKLGFATIETQAVDTSFSVVVQVLDANDNPTNVTQNTSVTLAVSSGTGVLGGIKTRTITAGTSTLTFIGMSYDEIEDDVVLSVTRTSGDVLTAGTSDAFDVLAGIKAVMSTPTNGSTFGSANVTFTWSAGANVDHYRLWVGSTPLFTSDDADIYRSSALATTSQAVTGIPTDGSTVYVRLYSYIAGVFESNDYTYTAFTAPSSAPNAPPPQLTNNGGNTIEEDQQDDDEEPFPVTPLEIVHTISGSGLCGMGSSMTLITMALSVCGLGMMRRSRRRRGNRK